VKAILQYTAERRPAYTATAQGAGFLNARGAVQLAAALAGRTLGTADPTRWSRQILWGNQPARGGVLTPAANAWQPGITWGAATTPAGQNIVWGTLTDSDLPWARRPETETGAHGGAHDAWPAPGLAVAAATAGSKNGGSRP
jgi:hypothetical protein